MHRYTATHSPHHHSHDHSTETEGEDLNMTHDDLDDLAELEFESVKLFLEKQFGDIGVDEKARTVAVNLDGMDATIDCTNYVSWHC
jgi:hypothetical protein